MKRLGLVALLLLIPRAAAADDCPPGSIFKQQDGFSFCEPTVCETDAQCNPGTEVCRQIGLCMQVGTLANPGVDAGKRLVVTQRCAPDKTCPQSTTCSEKGRCLSKAAAEKMGLLADPATAPATAPTPAAKKSCGCNTVPVASEGAVALSALALASLCARRRQRRSTSP